jgi:hypothetical protein
VQQEFLRVDGVDGARDPKFENRLGCLATGTVPVYLDEEQLLRCWSSTIGMRQRTLTASSATPRPD